MKKCIDVRMSVLLMMALMGCADQSQKDQRKPMGETAPVMIKNESGETLIGKVEQETSGFKDHSNAENQDQGLKFFLVAEDEEDKDQPGQLEDAIEPKIRVKGQVIELLEPIKLRDPSSQSLDPSAKLSRFNRDLFFVFPIRQGQCVVKFVEYENFLEKDLVKGSDAKSRLKGEYRLVPKFYEDRNHRYIELSKIFRNLPDYPESSADLSHRHTIDLSLSYDREISAEHCRDQNFHIVFKALGPLPKIDVVESGESIPSGKALLDVAAKGSIVLLKEKIKNPFNRNFKLWLKSSTKPLSLWQAVKRKDYRVVGERVVVVEPDRYFSARATIRLGQLKLNRSLPTANGQIQLTTEVLNLDGSGSNSIELKPLEEIDFIWLGIPNQVHAGESIFVNSPWMFHFPALNRATILEFPGFRAIIDLENAIKAGHATVLNLFSRDGKIKEHQLYDAHTVTGDRTLSIVFAGLEGEWRREIRVAYPQTKQDLVFDEVPRVPTEPANGFQYYRDLIKEKADRSFSLGHGFKPEWKQPSYFLSPQEEVLR